MATGICRTGFADAHQESSTVHTATGICRTGFADAHQESSTVHTATGICRTSFADAASGIVLAAVSKTRTTCAYCRVYSARLLTMERDTVRNM